MSAPEWSKHGDGFLTPVGTMRRLVEEAIRVRDLPNRQARRSARPVLRALADEVDLSFRKLTKDSQDEVMQRVLTELLPTKNRIRSMRIGLTVGFALDSAKARRERSHIGD